MSSSSSSTSDRYWAELGLAAPARRALIGAGLTKTSQLRTYSEAELSELHGIGPTALKILRPWLRK